MAIRCDKKTATILWSALTFAVNNGFGDSSNIEKMVTQNRLVDELLAELKKLKFDSRTDQRLQKGIENYIRDSMTDADRKAAKQIKERRLGNG